MEKIHNEIISLLKQNNVNASTIAQVMQLVFEIQIEQFKRLTK